jgi:hypothetical protein
MATATQRAEEADTSGGVGAVSLGQKMMSAVTGSVLTSLLSRSPLQSFHATSAILSFHLVFGADCAMECSPPMLQQKCNIGPRIPSQRFVPKNCSRSLCLPYSVLGRTAHLALLLQLESS